jgi:hypothetical protein
MQGKLLGTISTYVNEKGQLLIIHFASVKNFKKWGYNQAVHQLFIHFKKANDSIRSEV